MFKGDKVHFLVGQVSGLVKNFDNGIFSDTINVINVKLSIVVLNIEVYLPNSFKSKFYVFIRLS